MRIRVEMFKKKVKFTMRKVHLEIYSYISEGINIHGNGSLAYNITSFETTWLIPQFEKVFIVINKVRTLVRGVRSMHWGHYRNRFSIRHGAAGLKLHNANNRQLGTRCPYAVRVRYIIAAQT